VSAVGCVVQCKGNLVPHESPKGIACCDDVDLCNEYIEPTVVYRTTTFVPPGMLILTLLMVMKICKQKRFGCCLKVVSLSLKWGTARVSLVLTVGAVKSEIAMCIWQLWCHNFAK